MRIRSVKPEFFTDRVTGRWPTDMKLLYVGLWCLADDDGRFEWEPDLVRGQLFPYDPSFDTAGGLERLRETGRVVAYEQDGLRYGVIPSFVKHQHPDKKRESRLPLPPPLLLPDSSPTPPRLLPINEGLEGRGIGGDRIGSDLPPTMKRLAAHVDGISRHKDTIARFCGLWAEVRGGEYRVVGKRDGAAVKRLLGFAEATEAEIERRMRLAFADAWFRANGHLALFVSRWPNYDGVIVAAPNGRTGMAPPSKDFSGPTPF